MRPQLRRAPRQEERRLVVLLDHADSDRGRTKVGPRQCAAIESRDGVRERRASYQCTPRMRCASATASPEAFSSSLEGAPPLSPFAAEESGKTLDAMWSTWSTAFGASA